MARVLCMNAHSSVVWDKARCREQSASVASIVHEGRYTPTSSRPAAACDSGTIISGGEDVAARSAGIAEGPTRSGFGRILDTRRAISSASTPAPPGWGVAKCHKHCLCPATNSRLTALPTCTDPGPAAKVARASNTRRIRHGLAAFAEPQDGPTGVASSSGHSIRPGRTLTGSCRPSDMACVGDTSPVRDRARPG